MAIRAILFDFNGTLSDDEPILCELLGELFAERGKPMSPAEYYARFAGLSDPEIVREWLGHDDPLLLAEYERRYLARAAGGSTVSEDVRAAVRAAAARARVAVVSGAPRRSVETVLGGAGLAGLFEAVVTADDVAHGKPSPEGYRRALELLGVEPGEAAAIEDTEDGVAAAVAAGVRVVAVLGTADARRLEAAGEIAERLDAALVDRLLEAP